MTTEHLSLTAEDLGPVAERLRTANASYVTAYPGERDTRQPVHTVYGGAHLFKADVAQRLGAAALRALSEYAPDYATFGRAIGLAGAERIADVPGRFSRLKARLTADAAASDPAESPTAFAHSIYERVEEKLRREPVEDFRIDFEDGYGSRSDAEEDGHAVAAARELARGAAEGTLPPFVGLRVKPLSDELMPRSLRTLDLFVSTLAGGAARPAALIVTLPKITSPAQVSALSDVVDRLEARLSLPPGFLAIELMVETTQSIFDGEGRAALPRLVAAARGRCSGAHFGTYDYTAGCSITASHQHMLHPACDFAKHMMQVTLAGTGVFMSDGATNIMPVAVHRAGAGEALTEEQVDANQRAVHGAWQLHYDHVRHSLINAFYQGWDLHPAQLPTRYAAVYAFFLEGLDAASARLRNFIGKAAQATLAGDVFDDAATGQGLLNYFLRAMNCGAMTEVEAVAMSGLSLEELRGRSFARILRGRKGTGSADPEGSALR